MRRETIAIHAGYVTDPTTKAVAVPIYQTAAYAFDSADHGAALFDLTVPGNIYCRLSNPTNDVLEQRLAALEGGVAALTTGSGMAAIQYAIQNLTEVGTNIVTYPQLYGATYTLFAHVFHRQGVEVRLAREDSPAAVAALIDANTRAVYCESVGNPAGNISDIAALAEVAHRHGVPLIVDNTVATPMLLRPIEHGADVVVHSMTKFIGGHGTTMGGAIIDAGRFDWSAHPEKFAMLTSPETAYHDVVFTEQFGAAAFVAHCRSVCLRNGGATLAPLSAFLLLQGLETLPLRIERHVSNARRVAAFLREDPRVAWVNYAGFPDNPYHALGLRYLDGNFCSLMTFGVKGGFDVGRRFFDALMLFKRLVNLGDAKSLATHPASTTHRQLNAAELARTGVSPEMIRLSIGIEHIDDIIADLDQALEVAAGVATVSRATGAVPPARASAA
ncbi:O-acetylhomoserine aminocarboxypropyltransferase/cysteine synthase family protein [Acidiphilium sp.]|uniref:O-acetylhomoserine aminocarboxypropyltransferase/cysteine synthase family protein n=1 Tax=Acidiphilium sp. TaxID=527 RepID=UPI003D004F88